MNDNQDKHEEADEGKYEDAEDKEDEDEVAWCPPKRGWSWMTSRTKMRVRTRTSMTTRTRVKISRRMRWKMGCFPP